MVRGERETMERCVGRRDCWLRRNENQGREIRGKRKKQKYGKRRRE